jgi:hypothetical protein
MSTGNLFSLEDYFPELPKLSEVIISPSELSFFSLTVFSRVETESPLFSESLLVFFIGAFP